MSDPREEAEQAIMAAAEECGLTTHFHVSEKYRKKPLAAVRAAYRQGVAAELEACCPMGRAPMSAYEAMKARLAELRRAP